jgi:hypothetical protein
VKEESKGKKMENEEKKEQTSEREHRGKKCQCRLNMLTFFVLNKHH